MRTHECSPQEHGPSPPIESPQTAYSLVDEANVAAYDLLVAPNQFDRATHIKPCSMARPHMRIFYLSWMSGITGFFGWYAIPPLMPVIKTQLGLTDGEVLNSDIASTASTILSRIAAGPLLDRFGPRVVQSCVLWGGAIPILCAALVNSSTSLVLVRFGIGLVGCVFVSSQYWTTITFARNVAGAANAITGGFGLSGIGLAFLVLPFLNEAILSTASISEDLSWRLTIAMPAVLMVIMGTVLCFAVDSCPTVDFQQLMATKRHFERPVPLCSPHPISSRLSAPLSPDNPPQATTTLQSFRAVLTDSNVIVMIAQYAACFGTELQLNNMGALYFYTQFTNTGCNSSDTTTCSLLSKTHAATVASSFGLMNLFARALGGLASDAANRRRGMRGRRWVQFALLCVLSALVIDFCQAESLDASIALFMLVAIFAQATGGSTHGIVPYLNEQHTGTVNGVVCAGGNIGGVIYGILFRSTEGYTTGLRYIAVLCTADPTVEGHASCQLIDTEDET